MGKVIGAIGGSGRTKPLRRFKPVGFEGGGLSASFSGPRSNRILNLGEKPERQAAIFSVQEALRMGGSEIGRLRSQVTPGFGALTTARVNSLTSARQRAIGTLSENLRQRRVLGSSFAQDALARAEGEFGQQEAQIRAQSFLQELDLNTRLLDRETELFTNAAMTGLNNLNFEATLAANLAQNGTNALAQTAIQQSQLAQRQFENGLNFLGETITAAITRKPKPKS